MKNTNRLNGFKTLIYAFKDGSYNTRLSFLFMGFGQLARGQIGKGFFYALTQVLFALYMIFFGGNYIGHLFSGNLGNRLSGEQWNEKLQIFETMLSCILVQECFLVDYTVAFALTPVILG